MARQNEIAITNRDGAVSGSFRRGARDAISRMTGRGVCCSRWITYRLRYLRDLFPARYRTGARRRSGAGNPAGSRRFSERSTASDAAGVAGIDERFAAVLSGG